VITSKDEKGQVTVGLDVGDKNIHACFLNQDGAIVEESKLGATPGSLRRRFSSEQRYRIILSGGGSARNGRRPPFIHK